MNLSVERVVVPAVFCCLSWLTAQPASSATISFADDTRAAGTQVSEIPTPTSFGVIKVTPQVMLFEVGPGGTAATHGWQTWARGYTGDVYWTQEATSVALEYPTGLLGFSMGFQPNEFGLADIELRIDRPSFPIILQTITAEGNSGANSITFGSFSGSLEGFTLTLSSAKSFAFRLVNVIIPDSAVLQGSVPVALASPVQPLVTPVPEPANVLLLAAGLAILLALGHRHRPNESIRNCGVSGSTVTPRQHGSPGTTAETSPPGTAGACAARC